MKPMGIARSPFNHVTMASRYDDRINTIEQNGNARPTYDSDTESETSDNTPMPGLYRRQKRDSSSDEDDIDVPGLDDNPSSSDSDDDSVPYLRGYTDTSDDDNIFVPTFLTRTNGTDYYDRGARSHLKRVPHIGRASRGALIDRGANGGIIGEDARILQIHRVSPVDVAGIQDQQLRSLKIVDACAKITTQKGDIIGMFHQYAYLGHGKTIHSALQIESHEDNRVNERPYKLGGSQHLHLTGGYIIPIDIICGLPYISMRPCTDKEFDTLPHVSFTGSTPWNPKALDSSLSNTISWFEMIQTRVERDNDTFDLTVDANEISNPTMSSSGAEYTAYDDITQQLWEELLTLNDTPAEEVFRKYHAAFP